MADTVKLSKSLHAVPGKIDSRNGEWLPLYIHAIDTAGVMKHLVEDWLPSHVKRDLCQNIDPDTFTNLCVFLALSHDIGKITPVMISKMLQNDSKESVESESTPFQSSGALKTASKLTPVTARLQDAVPVIPAHSSFEPNANCSPHDLAGEAILLHLGVHESVAVVVGAHHGKPQSSASRPELQTEIYSYNYFGSHNSTGESASVWDSLWSEFLSFALSYSGFRSVSDLPELNMASEMVLSGLLIMSDWIASNTSLFPLISANQNGLDFSPEDLECRVEHGWSEIGLPAPWVPKENYNQNSFCNDFGFQPNDMQTLVIDAMEKSERPGLLIIEAPMGLGKTEAALSAAGIMAEKCGCGGIFFGLPTQATANGIFTRLLEWANGQSEGTVLSIRLAHSRACLNSDYTSLCHMGSADAEVQQEEGVIRHEWFEGRKQALLADFTIGTVDQLLLAGAKKRHVMLRHLGLCGKAVILDEVHSYDPCMNEYMDTVLSWLGSYNTPVIMLSATLPRSRRKDMIKAYTGMKESEYNREQTDASGYPLITWTDGGHIHQASTHTNAGKRKIYIERDSPENAANRLEDALSEGGCAGVIVSTVSCAQKLAAEFKQKLPDKEVILIHSRFTDADRSELEQLVMKKVGKASTSEDRNNVIVVGTQVLEQSLDIDFDFLITDLCPMDLLLQRIGRLHRHNRIRPKKLKDAKCIVIGANGGFDKGALCVYGEWLLSRTRDALTDEIVIPDMIPDLVEKVYAEPDEQMLKNTEIEKSWNAYCIDIQRAKSKADAFTIKKAQPTSSRFRQKTIRGLIDVDADQSKLSEAEKEAKEQLMVRDGDPSVDVLVMIRHNNGDIGFVPWQYDGDCIDASKTLSEKEGVEIAKQKVKLPMSLCIPYMIETTVAELEMIETQYVKKWKNSPLLRGCYFLLLDEDYQTEINGFLLKYSHDYGLMCEKK